MVLRVGNERSLSDNLYGIGNVILSVVIVKEFEAESSYGAVIGDESLFSQDPDVTGSQQAMNVGRPENVLSVIDLSKEEEDAAMKCSFDILEVAIEINGTFFKLNAFFNLQQ